VAGIYAKIPCCSSSNLIEMKGEQCPEAEYNMPVQHYYKVLL